MTDTMKVQLAYPRDGHKADEVIDLEVGEARELIYAGRARVPDDEKPAASSARTRK